jgi:hypothetical protein
MGWWGGGLEVGVPTGGCMSKASMSSKGALVGLRLFSCVGGLGGPCGRIVAWQRRLQSVVGWTVGRPGSGGVCRYGCMQSMKCMCKVADGGVST